jgi:DNA-binding MarR family transcriptional regulator
MTNRVDRLAARGFVERRPAPNDRRGVLVRLTDAGRQVVDAAFEDLLAQEQRLLASLPVAGRQALAANLRRLLTTLEG